MAIKSGQFLHVANSYLIDRIQTAGAGNLNIPEERIYELGNYQTVGLIRDTPDLSFDLESLDPTVEIEAILMNLDPTAVLAGDEIDFADCVPIDIVAPFKDQGGVFTTVKGVVVPELRMESAAYRAGVRTNFTKQFSLRGDSIFYTQGTPYYEEFTVPGVGGVGPYAIANPNALPYVESGDTRHILNARLVFASGATRRLVFGVDYTTTVTGLTLTTAPAAGTILQVSYGSPDVATYAQAVHPDSTVKPAAARARNVSVFVGPQGGPLVKWLGVQTAEVNWRVNLDRDEELGNSQVVSSDYDVAEVSGSIAIRARDVEYLFDRIAEVTNTATTGVVAGALSSVPLEVQIEIENITTGDVEQTLFVPDAVIQPPAIQGRVQQKIETTFPFTSEGGTLLTYSGERPAS